MTAKFKAMSVFLPGHRLSLSLFPREETGGGLGQGFSRRCSEVLGCPALLPFCRELLCAEPRDKVKAREFCPGEDGAWLGLNSSARVRLPALSNHNTVCFD